MSDEDPRRELPSISSILEMPGMGELLHTHPRSVVVDAARSVVGAARRTGNALPSFPEWASLVARELSRRGTPSLRPVINATGVILHTNLGRAPLADSAIAALQTVGSAFSSLEYDIALGERGSRHVHCQELLRELTGAEDALVVNNGAAALFLALNSLALDGEVLVSRGELVEIGGSFRVPDIMERSGVRLVEVGTTNRTHADDYRRAITRATRAIVKVHRSNFSVAGFVAEVAVDDLAFIAGEHGFPVIHDLGSGLLISLERLGLRGEPTAREALAAGATVVTMSGDKLLGGPQAGIIVGSSAAISRLRSNPLARAVRVGKLTLAALEATHALYLDEERALREIPVLEMVSAPVAHLDRRAASMQRALSVVGIDAQIVPSIATVGAGAFPTNEIESRALRLPGNAEAVESALRDASPPVIARIRDGHVLIDLRSVRERDDAALVDCIANAHRTDG